MFLWNKGEDMKFKGFINGNEIEFDGDVKELCRCGF